MESKTNKWLEVRNPAKDEVIALVPNLQRRVRFSLQLFLSGFNGLDDLMIPCAPAQVARNRVFDLLSGRGRVFLEKRFRRHQDPGRTKPTLHRSVIDEGSLKRVKPIPIPETFDGQDFFSLHFGSQDQTGVHRSPIQKHGAGPAFTDPTPFFGPRQR